MVSHPIDLSTHPTPRIMLVVPIFLLVGIWILHAIGVMGFTDALWGSAFFVIMAVVWSLAWTRSLGGSIEIAKDGIVQRSHGATISYPRDYIRGVRLRRLRDYKGAQGVQSWTYRFLLIPLDKLVIEIELTRALRKNWFHERFGPRETGIPLFVKTYLLQPKDPRQFIRDATALLGAEIVEPEPTEIDAEFVT